MALLKTDQRWERLRELAEKEGAHDVVALMERAERELDSDVAAQQARFDSYLPARSPDEPHDEHCQITRLGPKHCCTCESNKTRRRQQIANAADAEDYDFRASLGSFESYAFDTLVKTNKARRT